MGINFKKNVFVVGFNPSVYTRYNCNIVRGFQQNINRNSNADENKLY